MGPITTDQSHQVLATLITNVDWGQVDFELSGLQDSVVCNPRGAGVEFTRFLQNGCRMPVGGLKVILRTFNPRAFPGLGEGWRFVAKEHDVGNDTLTEVDFDQVDFVTGLQGREVSITGEEKLARLKAGKAIRLGAGVFYGLWVDYQINQKNSVLETLHRLKKIVYLDFPGDVLLAPDRRHHVLCLEWRRGRWDWGADWLAYKSGGTHYVSAVYSPR